MEIGWRAAGPMVCAASVVALAACDSAGDGQAGVPSSLPAGSTAISAATWTDGEWPFTVPEGELRCYVGDSMVTFTANGVEYGLNSTAMKFGGFRDIDQIRPGETSYVEINGERQRVEHNRVSSSGVLSRGEKLCPRITVKAN